MNPANSVSQRHNTFIILLGTTLMGPLVFAKENNLDCFVNRHAKKIAQYLQRSDGHCVEHDSSIDPYVILPGSGARPPRDTHRERASVGYLPNILKKTAIHNISVNKQYYMQSKDSVVASSGFASDTLTDLAITIKSCSEESVSLYYLTQFSGTEMYSYDFKPSKVFIKLITKRSTSQLRIDFGGTYDGDEYLSYSYKCNFVN